MSSLLLPIQTTGFSVGSSSDELTGSNMPILAYSVKCLRRAMYAATSAGAIRIVPSTRTYRSWRVAQSLYTVAVETPICAATARTVSKACSTGAANGLRNGA